MHAAPLGGRPPVHAPEDYAILLEHGSQAPSAPPPHLHPQPSRRHCRWRHRCHRHPHCQHCTRPECCRWSRGTPPVLLRRSSAGSCEGRGDAGVAPATLRMTAAPGPNPAHACMHPSHADVCSSRGVSTSFSRSKFVLSGMAGTEPSDTALRLGNRSRSDRSSWGGTDLGGRCSAGSSANHALNGNAKLLFVREGNTSALGVLLVTSVMRPGESCQGSPPTPVAFARTVRVRDRVTRHCSERLPVNETKRRNTRLFRLRGGNSMKVARKDSWRQSG